jgi:hypothetical protein
MTRQAAGNRDPERPESTPRPGAEIAESMRRAAGAISAAVDEHYLFSAVMLQRPTPGGDLQTLLVEVMDCGVEAGDHRWMAAAYDEEHQRQTPTCYAESLAQLGARIPWTDLDR